MKTLALIAVLGSGCANTDSSDLLTTRNDLSCRD